MLDQYIDNLNNDIIKEICNLVNIPSVSEETGNSEMPFGEGCKNVLEYTLNLGKRLGFRTKNIDNYCGYIEFGEGEKLVGIIGHLDVVPSGDGWDTPPFEANIRDGKIFGRGTIDDKGPVISSLYAMKAVKDNLKINSRVRLILGLNEEKGWKCIKHYKEKEEHPTIGFSPDADFPCIYAEKGIATIYLKEDYTKYKCLPIKITKIDCKNNAINVVPKYCSVNLKLNLAEIEMGNCIKFIDDTIKELNYDISYTTDEENIYLVSRGIQAHAAHPDLGKNAISQMIILLNRIYKHFNYNINMLDFFDKHIGMEFNGESLGINFEDESGKLTLNVGHFSLENSKLKIKMNLRIPVKTLPDIINKKFIESINKYNNLSYNTISLAPALYIPKDNLLVKTLCDTFNKFTNKHYEPIAIGGGTYAKAFKNCVSFGANFPGHKDMCHQTDEYIEIDNLILCSKIYTEAIITLTSENFKIQ